jgi:hypothetical protein
MTQGGSKTSIHMKDLKPIFYNNGFKNIKHNNPYSCMLTTILRHGTSWTPIVSMGWFKTYQEILVINVSEPKLHCYGCTEIGMTNKTSIYYS